MGYGEIDVCRKMAEHDSSPSSGLSIPRHGQAKTFSVSLHDHSIDVAEVACSLDGSPRFEGGTEKCRLCGQSLFQKPVHTRNPYYFKILACFVEAYWTESSFYQNITPSYYSEASLSNHVLVILERVPHFCEAVSRKFCSCYGVLCTQGLSQTIFSLSLNQLAIFLLAQEKSDRKASAAAVDGGEETETQHGARYAVLPGLERSNGLFHYVSVSIRPESTTNRSSILVTDPRSRTDRVTSFLPHHNCTISFKTRRRLWNRTTVPVVIESDMIEGTWSFLGQCGLNLVDCFFPFLFCYWRRTQITVTERPNPAPTSRPSAVSSRPRFSASFSWSAKWSVSLGPWPGGGDGGGGNRMWHQRKGTKGK